MGIHLASEHTYANHQKLCFYGLLQRIKNTRASSRFFILFVSLEKLRFSDDLNMAEARGLDFC